MNLNGHVAIPDDVRQALGLHPGDIVSFERSDAGVRLVKGEEPAAQTFEDRLARARALSAPLPLGMSTDEYMAWIREPLE
ncbi:AbrB/MazE/SpoVT family DNA-binding domain-containing protein [Sphingomonas sp. BE138]|uniref:AbrB/MazE/SpoVT family DNA-binding domain-containing protein n=1 Tax=Sphingomonas sp. BE138 TaxID=2817845 RepID=UPI00286B3A35|nr:AbrB/MazE/SpoVT family DNA-binding domain-containing protein [Sphingomonas sp. BE138]